MSQIVESTKSTNIEESNESERVDRSSKSIESSTNEQSTDFNLTKSESNEKQQIGDRSLVVDQQQIADQPDGKADKRTVRFMKKCQKIISNAYTMKKRRKTIMNKNNADSSQRSNIIQQELISEQLEQNSQSTLNQQSNISEQQRSSNHQSNVDKSNDQSNDQLNDQLNDNRSADQVSDRQSNDRLDNQSNLQQVNELNGLESSKVELIQNQANDQQPEVQVNDIESKMNLNDIVDVKIDDKSEAENVKIQINTPIKTVPVKHENESKSEIDLKEKLLNDEQTVHSINEQVKSDEISKSHQSIQNDKEQSQREISAEIPELLLTENNRRNNSNKLLVGLMLLFKFFTYFIIKFISLFHPAKRNVLSPINEPLLLLSASEISERIKNGQLKCEHVISAYIHRIENVQPKLNAMIDNCFEDALKRAREIDEQLKDLKLAEELKKLPLLGVPFTCKDSISVKGLAHTAGVKIRKGIKADQDATVIKNLRSAGAIALGLTNTPELVLWSDSHNKLYGRSNNPYDISRIVGGSSGGEGCLIAAAGSLIGVGSDVAGSIRIPSMFNGVFGHKTILKYIPVDGMFPAPPERYKAFLSYGPICRYAKDLPIALKAMGGDLTNELRLDEPVDFGKIKIYYMEHDGGNPLTSFVDQRIINSMHKVIKYFKNEYGTEAEQININKFRHSLAFFGTVCVKGEMKIEDYVSPTGHVNVFWEMLKSFFGKSDITRPILIQILNQNSPYCNPKSSAYKRFTKMLEELKPKVHDLLSNDAVLMMPTWPTIAPKHQTTILRGFDAVYTIIMNALEIPATHCPVGLTKEEGLPLGFTVAAGPGYDRISIAFAKEIEKVFGGWVAPSSKLNSS